MLKNLFKKRYDPNEEIEKLLIEIGKAWAGIFESYTIPLIEYDRVKQEIRFWDELGKREENLYALLNRYEAKNRFVVVSQNDMWRLLMWYGTLKYDNPLVLSDEEGDRFFKNEVKRQYMIVDVFIPNGSLRKNYEVYAEDNTGAILGSKFSEEKGETIEEVKSILQELQQGISKKVSRSFLDLGEVDQNIKLD
ncbi:MAG: hypothetical protein H7Y09_10725 [Chitinophagaceae bacterium]|nr:hypothetical protein [Anaerolineae bacterium]